MSGKNYCLYPCVAAELGKAADHAYLIVGFLNKGNIILKKMKKQKICSGSKTELYFE